MRNRHRARPRRSHPQCRVNIQPWHAGRLWISLVARIRVTVPMCPLRLPRILWHRQYTSGLCAHPLPALRRPRSSSIRPSKPRTLLPHPPRRMVWTTIYRRQVARKRLHGSRAMNAAYASCIRSTIQQARRPTSVCLVLRGARPSVTASTREWRSISTRPQANLVTPLLPAVLPPGAVLLRLCTLCPHRRPCLACRLHRRSLVCALKARPNPIQALRATSLRVHR